MPEKSLLAPFKRVLNSPFSAGEAVGLLWVWSLIGVLGFARTFLNVYLPARDGYDIREYLIGRDFVNVWVGAKLVLESKLSKLYMLADYQQEMNRIIGHPYKLHNFSYPPHLLLFIPVFGLLPYLPSLALWIAAGTACFLLALRAQEFYKIKWPALALAALSPASFANLASGQNGPFIAALFLGGLYMCETAPVAGGVLFGLLTVKPHMGVLVAPVLLIRRNWKCIGAAVVTALVLTLLSVAFWGAAPWHDYVTKTMRYQTELLNLDRGFYPKMMPGVYADVVTALHQPRWAGMAAAALAALLAFFLSLRAVWKEGLTPRSILLLALGTIVILPYSFNYDMLPVAGAMIVFLGALHSIGMWQHLVLGLLWALPLAVTEFKGFAYFPFSTAILMVSLMVISFHAGVREPDGKT